jgi:CubicO group peptidase (beta-lactamase class C family)
MRSAIDVQEDYYSPLSSVARLYITSDLDHFLRRNRSQYDTPGHWDYRSVDTAVLGAVLTELNGRPLPDLVAERLWDPLGAEADATWNLDRDDGRAKAFCCLNATATDFARLGQLVLDRGRVGEVQVVSEEWIERLSDRRIDLGDGWAYSAHWWSPRPGTVMANGIYGQYVVAEPDRNVVVVKLSDDELGQDDLAILAALDLIVEVATQR